MITLQYPAYTPTESLELSSPVKGDNRVQESKMKIVITRDNTQRTYIKDIGTKIMELHFEKICKDDRDLAVAFFRGLSSNYLRYIDYIPRSTSNPNVFTFDNWILNLLEDIEITSSSRGLYEFTILAESWPTVTI